MSAWEAKIADDLPYGGVRLLWIRDGGGGRQITNGDIVTQLSNEGVASTEVEPLRLTDDLARSLLDALTRWYHGAEDTRSLRKDYEHEKQRVDQFIAHLTRRGD